MSSGVTVKLEELEKLCEAATPGDWRTYPIYRDESYAEVLMGDKEDPRKLVLGCQADADLIVAARMYMPKLIAVAKAARLLAGDGIVKEIEGGSYLYVVESRFRESVKKALADLEQE